MTPQPAILLIDTSIFLNVLNVPGRNGEREAVMATFAQEIQRGSTLLLPFATIVEMGSHLSRLAEGGNVRRDYASRFVAQVQMARDGRAPWTVMRVPDAARLTGWLDDFPNSAMQGISLTDHTIIKEWEEQCELHPHRRVRIWSLDVHLQGYDSHPG